MLAIVKALPSLTLFKFAGVGGLATLIHSAIYLLAIHYLGAQEHLANLLGFIVALLFSYIGQRYWTFAEKEVTNETRARLKFLVSSLTSLGFNAFWVYTTTNILHLPPEYAVIGIAFITPIVIFILLKYWVFV